MDEISYSAEERLPASREIVDMLTEHRYRALIERFSGVPEADIASAISELPDKYHPQLFRLLPKDVAAEVFVQMEPRMQESLINSFTDAELSAMLDEIYLDDTVDIIEEMPALLVKRILKNSSGENRSLINQLLKYPKDSAGTIMTTEYVRLKRDMTVSDALAHLRRVAIDKETIYTCYVTDDNRKLLGLVTAKQLLISSLDTLLSDIMEESVIFVTTTDDQEEVANKFNKYGFMTDEAACVGCAACAMMCPDCVITVER